METDVLKGLHEDTGYIFNNGTQPFDFCLFISSTQPEL